MRQSNFAAGSSSSLELALPGLLGLVLSGGASTRMGTDKALLERQGEPQLQATFRLLSRHVRACFVSLRSDQRNEPVRAALPGIIDRIDAAGPAAGLLAAHSAYPEAAWLVVACDLPLLQSSTLETLVRARDRVHGAIAYRSAVDGLPEPLCALWEPPSLARLAQQAKAARYRLREVLRSADTLLLQAPQNGELDNINTPLEWQRINLQTGQGSRE